MWEIVGNQMIVERLHRVVREGRVPHALLFTGPAGIGKTHLALALAKALNCTGEDPPCGRCQACRQIGSGSHPDVVVISRLEGKDNIQIQQVRELREAASLRPFQGRWKVYILTQAEDLTPQAADALLKTLEEPQPLVKLVLTASDTHALPETIVSRCRVIPLQRPSSNDIEAVLEARGRDVETARRIARLARGNVGWALRAAGQPKLISQQEELIEKLSQVPDLSLRARLELAEQIAADRKDRSSIRRHPEVLMLLARDLLLIGQGVKPLLVSQGEHHLLEGQSGRLGLPRIESYIERIRDAMERIDQNVDPRLTLEALMLSLP